METKTGIETGSCGHKFLRPEGYTDKECLECLPKPHHTPTPVEDIDSGNLLQVAKFALDCIIEQNLWDEEHSDTGPTLQNKNAETMLQVAIAKAEAK